MDFIMSCRGRSGDGYSDREGAVKFLAVDGGAGQLHRSQEVSRTAWLKQVQDSSGCVFLDKTVVNKGHVLFFIHGFNMDQFDTLERHRLLKQGLADQGYRGSVVSFDWPSDGSVLGYCSDRRDARRAADTLFYQGLRWLARLQRPDCAYNVHALAHSMGAFLLREALDYADDDPATAQVGWRLAQVALVAADISQKSMRQGGDNASSLYRRAARITNYYSPFDGALQVSEVKRIGVAPRLGRVGLPEGAPQNGVNLYCGSYYRDNAADAEEGVSWSHRWYFEDQRFYEDLAMTLDGKLDREVLPTREWSDRGNLALV